MNSKNILLAGPNKTLDQIALRMRQLTHHNFLKANQIQNLLKTVDSGNPDALVLAIPRRQSSIYFELLRTLPKYISPKKVLLVSEIKDADMMYEALKGGFSNLIIGNTTTETIGKSILKKLKSIINETKTNKILAIGAHPDDVEIGCGGTLKKHSQKGDEVMILTLTKGARGGNKQEREQESNLAANSLNAKLIMYDLDDTNLSNGGDTITSIESTIKSFSPNIIYTHSLNDTHQDHRATHYATLVAARQIKHIYAYLAPSGTIDFHPRYFEHIEDFISDKMDAINCFTSQTIVSGRPYLKSSMIESTAEYWGRFSNYGLVEPFEVIRA